MKFLVDQMLGTLAKWLRLCGLDTFYATQKVNDDDLLTIAKKDHRILITRDKELHQRAKKQSIQSLFTQSISLSEQLQLVFDSFPQLLDELEPLTRCSLCNTPIKSIEKKSISTQVPERVFLQHEHFWQCPNCKQVYWKGTHFEKILQRITKLKQNTEQNN